MDKAIEDALYFVAEKGWVDATQSYFPTLVTYLGTALSADCALVDELLPDNRTARTVGIYAKGHVVPNLEYSLEGTPCDNVIGKKLCCYPCGIQQLFPDDRLLAQMAAESYVGVPLWDSQGKPNGLIAVIRSTPLTPDERKTAEAVLQIVAVRCAHELDSMRHESRLREYAVLLHSLVDGFYFADHQGRFIDANVSYCNLTGYTLEELLSMSVFDIEASESPREVEEHIACVIRCGHDRFESRLRRKDGSTFEVEISAQYWPHNAGRFAVIVRDISFVKSAARERASLELQLEHSKRLEAIGRLAGGVAHDFNNMLTVIVGQAELLLSDETLSASTRNDVREIRSAAERSATLTSQLLAFARKQPAAPMVINLNETIERMLDILRRLIGEDIELNWTPQSNIWNVRLDPTQIDRVVTDLCVNARDALNGIGRISISTHNTQHIVGAVDDEHPCIDRGAHSGDFVCLTIRDNGPGFDEAVRKHLFEPFFSTKKAGLGTGLGLATVYGVVRQNHGFVEVDSEPEHGATFKLYFPRCLTAVSLPIDSAEAKREVSRRHTILLVEDEPRVMRLVGAMLSSMGFNVLTAGDPQEALQIARRKGSEIDLLLTDVVMPKMNGKELWAQVRLVLPQIKCLFMSGYNAEVVASRGVLEAGIHFIQKPFKIAELGLSIDAALFGKSPD